MTIRFKCECGKQYEVKDELAGKQAKCKSCGAKVLVPQPSAPEPLTTPDDDFWRDLPAADPAAPREYPVSPIQAPKKEPGGDRKKCPQCGSSKIRALWSGEAKEFREAKGRLSLVQPQRCLMCDHEWEPEPTRLVYGLGLLGFSIVVLFGLWLCWFGFGGVVGLVDPGFSDLRSPVTLITIGVIGASILLVGGASILFFVFRFFGVNLDDAEYDLDENE